ncbi:DNA repair protein RecO [Staphylococcus intermedius]|uniref:DNA repair protein RecO n=1 Tax=Staphylococcus intermedius NCTC 11048 TaxID=1141106 RepID=A0A380G9H8_STAIN|nr:DNA repair protein RecO [Staphylococcus intermedius]PCF88093.1 DNA repair protein RecO [Staphylococcus intermedius]PCF88807.1 DNA repair protein RecO [Staphylococcus intermedius]PNZ51630.1 DNA repair protein RecO [Staphylococcus intermedius NCTC 11048]SUM46621.1 DNA repair protein RecO [Staphylococcus intermedius NCTC 11048]
MLVKQKGIIIKAVDYGESDKIITILNEHGAKVPLMVRRAKKVKSGLQATTQIFVQGLFIYNQWKGMGTLTSVDVLNLNYELRQDIFAHSYASLCLETVDRAMEADEINPGMYQLLNFSFERLQEGVSPQLIANIVMLKCMPRFGFDIDLSKCVLTDTTNPAQLTHFSFKYDGIIASEVTYRDPHALPLSNKTIYLTYVLKDLPLGKIKSLRIQDGIVEEMSKFILLLYKEYAGMYFKSQRLINQLNRLQVTDLAED